MRIASIVAGLRLLSRNAENDRSVDISLVKLVEDTVILCRQRFLASEIKIEIDSSLLASGQDIIKCRTIEFSQVLLSLLNNTFDAVSELPEKWININLLAKAEWYEIEVIDSGKGIRSEIQEKIMNPFFTTKEIGKGIGLGLTVSKGIIERHGGQLRLDSSYQNTKFVIQLPRIQS